MGWKKQTEVTKESRHDESHFCVFLSPNSRAWNMVKVKQMIAIKISMIQAMCRKNQGNRNWSGTDGEVETAFWVD